MTSPMQFQTSSAGAGRIRMLCAAFTLIELLVVMAIIGLLATIGLPALKGFGKGTGMAGAQRQLLDDLAFARLRAISGRTTIYMVFVPPGIMAHFADLNQLTITSANRDRWSRQLTNLITGQYTAYALLTKRTVGDQPGQENPRYISEWKRLPQGTLYRLQLPRTIAPGAGRAGSLGGRKRFFHGPQRLPSVARRGDEAARQLHEPFHSR